MALSTRFDLASLSKVVGTTSAVALLYQHGFIGLHDKLSDPHLLGPAFGVHGKEDVTVLNCLLHNAGFGPDPSPNFWDPAFGCAGAPLPVNETFACSQRAFEATQAARLAHPVGTTYVYSDLSMITLMFAVGATVDRHALVSESDMLPRCRSRAALTPAARLQCAFEAYVRVRVLAPAGTNATGYLPTTPGDCAPTGVPAGEAVQTTLQGRVEDGNAYMLGGISGHAGLFAPVSDLATFMHGYMFDDDWVLNATTKALFTTEYNHTQSSRALGWNTNDPTVFDEGWGGACGNLSSTTYMHLGYTGTTICADPVREVFAILLTNRVYPDDSDYTRAAIKQLRKDFNNAVARVIDSGLVH